MNGTKTRRTRKPQFADALVWVWGVTPVWDRLDAGETAELDELLGKAAIRSGFDLSRLSGREAARLERLVGQVGGRDFAAERRREAEIEKQQDEEARSMRRSFSKEEPANLFLRLYQELADENLLLDDVEVLVGLVCQFASRRTFVPEVRFSGSGRDLTMHLNLNAGMWGGKQIGSADGWRARAEHLNAEGWIVFEGRGPQRTIRLGPKLEAALEPAPAMPLEEVLA